MAHETALETQLFPIRPALRFAVRATRFGFGDMTYRAPNPAYGALITYYLASAASNTSLQILDSSGAPVRTIACTGQAGLNRVTWDLRYAPPSGEPAGRRAAAHLGPQALPGIYTARLLVDGKPFDQKFQLELDPALGVSKEDLQAEFDTARGIVRMQSAVNAALANLRSLRGQHSAEADELSAELTRPASLGRSETGPRLKENLDALFTMIDTANAAPTSAQMRYYDELRAQFEEIMQKVDALAKNPVAEPGRR